MIVARPGPSASAVEPIPESDLAPRRGLSLIVVVAVMSGLLAGALGGAIGYVAATKHERPGVVLGAQTRGDGSNVRRGPDSVASLVSRVMPSVVTVQGASPQGESLGSGFVITADGYVVTNEHVVSDVPDRAVRVTLSDTTTVPARVVGRDAESDIAVLKVERANLRPVELGDSDSVAPGDPVV